MTHKLFVANEKQLIRDLLVSGGRLQRRWILASVFQIDNLDVLQGHLIWLVLLAPVEPLYGPGFFRFELHIEIAACSHELHEDCLLLRFVKIFNGVSAEEIINNVFEWHSFYDLSVDIPRELFKFGYLAAGLACPFINLSQHFW